ncbi:hypothetical protein GOB84_18450 [Acetobacter sp. LMG 1637]|uniref:Uncharacterized protein n=1 Tax=Acetobacter fallax TaxID=1737473 RepID=A0ABX0KE94_9PROT|nr:hypothetical protein [Acetobacter fallax]
MIKRFPKALLLLRVEASWLAAGDEDRSGSEGVVESLDHAAPSEIA